MSSVIVVRAACNADTAQRATVVRECWAQHRTPAFFMFFFQELTLQCVVLCGAVLFIFCGASVGACCLLLPAAAIVVAISVYVAHGVLADKQVLGIHKETFGYVAELCGPLVTEPCKISPPIVFENDMRELLDAQPVHKQVVGTVSVSEFWGPSRSGWLHALAVHQQWQCRGVGGALVSACRRHAATTGLESLETLVSHLQPRARSLLHAAGWELRGSYHRQLLGAALTLPVLRLGVDLPHA